MNKILISGVVLLVLISGGFFFYQKESVEPPVSCTEELKVCPDGSFVARQGPLCEFAECPMVEQTTTPTPPPPVVEQPLAACIRAGCSGQACVDEATFNENPWMTTCEFRPEYACYQQATCERQVSGQCGFTQTDELAMCLADVQAE